MKLVEYDHVAINYGNTVHLVHPQGRHKTICGIFLGDRRWNFVLSMEHEPYQTGRFCKTCTKIARPADA